MGDYKTVFSKYLSFSLHDRLDQHSLLRESARLFLDSGDADTIFAHELAHQIFVHRSIMGASKAYESAALLDKELALLSLNVARVAHDKSGEIIPYLEEVIYYSTGEEKKLLELELKQLQSQR